jgi:hypothetical protein
MQQLPSFSLGITLEFHGKKLKNSSSEEKKNNLCEKHLDVSP